MKKFLLTMTTVALVVAGLSACNGSTAKRAGDLLKKATKTVGKYGDDVARGVKMQKCKACHGHGCAICGDGYVIEFGTK